MTERCISSELQQGPLCKGGLRATFYRDAFTPLTPLREMAALLYDDPQAVMALSSQVLVRKGLAGIRFKDR